MYRMLTAAVVVCSLSACSDETTEPVVEHGPITGTWKALEWIYTTDSGVTTDLTVEGIPCHVGQRCKRFFLHGTRHPNYTLGYVQEAYDACCDEARGGWVHEPTSNERMDLGTVLVEGTAVTFSSGENKWTNPVTSSTPSRTPRYWFGELRGDTLLLGGDTDWGRLTVTWYRCKTAMPDSRSRC